MGDAEKAENGARRLTALLDRVLAAPREDCELLYGRCGYLHALLFARLRALGGKKKDQLLPMSLFRRVVEQVVEEGLANADRDEDEEKDENASTKTRVPRLVHAWRGKRYLGAAHGACGIVTTLFQCWEEFGDAVFQSQSRSSDALISFILRKRSGRDALSSAVCILRRRQLALERVVQERERVGAVVLRTARPA